MESTNLTDYYEVLQLSPNADAHTVERVFRILAKRLHPDNHETGDAESFNQLREAHTVLSDPDKRAEYDVHYEEVRGRIWQIFDQASAADSFEGDKRVFDGILSLLYVARRRDVAHCGMGPVELERMLGCPGEHLDFHIWYLIKKNWIKRLDTGQLALTVEGVDEVVSGSLLLKRDRLLTGTIERAENGDHGDSDGVTSPDQIEGGTKIESSGDSTEEPSDS